MLVGCGAWGGECGLFRLLVIVWMHNAVKEECIVSTSTSTLLAGTVSVRITGVSTSFQSAVVVGRGSIY